jgi:FkbM family methyltransferase
MKKTLCLLYLLPSLLFSVQPVIEDLPWISASDADTLKYTSPFLPNNPIILEAGVCDANDTISMVNLWPEATIYGFEPNPDLYPIAERKIRPFKNIFLYPLALFDRIGKITFYKSGSIPGASSVLFDNLDYINMPEDIEYNGVNYRDTSVTVDCTTIDHWSEVTRVNQIDYIWLDTEGAELYILQNAKRILPTVRVISIEVNFHEFRVGMTQFSDLYSFLTENGFKIKYIWGRSDWQGVAVFVNASLVE